MKVYALNADGATGNLLATVPTDANGFYAADVGDYRGPVLVEASGSYTDEATGAARTISPGAPLRAAFDNVTSNVTVAVTPLTEIAVRKALALTPAAIRAANALVSDLFKVDIIATKPVDPVAAKLQVATRAQQDYTLALAAVSQMAKTNQSDVGDVVGAISAGITGSTVSAAVSTQFNTAFLTFLGSQSNQTGVSQTPPPLPPATDPSGVWTKTAVLTLSIGGSSGDIGGVQATVDLPAGVTLPLNPATGLPAVGAVTATGGAAGSLVAVNAAIPGKIVLAIVSAAGFGPGDFVILDCTVSPGVTVAPGDFAVEPGADIVSLKGIAMSGATVALRSVIE